MYAGFLKDCIGTCEPRISRSTDGGYTWTESQFPLRGPGCCYWVSDVAIDPKTPISFTPVQPLAGKGSGSGLWKSEDGGANWVNLMSGDINFIRVDPRNPGTIYAQGGRLYKSTDGGQTFVETGTASCGVLVIDLQNSATLYCSSGNDVVRSTDAGATWNVVGSGLAGYVSSLTIDPRDPTELYAGTSSGLFVINVGPSTSLQTGTRK